MRGFGGDDIMHGGDGRNGFDGGAGNDQLFGDEKDDVLVGEVIQCSAPNTCTPASFGVDQLTVERRGSRISRPLSWAAARESSPCSGHRLADGAPGDDETSGGDPTMDTTSGRLG